ncbi:MAG TPA: bifunctional diguanylate cyclase/phosphodiesterase [Pseudonocardia sp.]
MVAVDRHAVGAMRRLRTRGLVAATTAVLAVAVGLLTAWTVLLGRGGGEPVRAQVALAVLVVLVLALGVAGVALVVGDEDAPAGHDPLTGLPDRALLRRRLERVLTAPGGEPFAVALVGLDGFRGVNDTLGHAAGDELLQVVARRLLGCLREGDLAARLDGDEFAVLVEGVDTDQARAVARRVVDALQEPFALAGRRAAVGASAGVVHAVPDPALPDPVAAAEDLLRDADLALLVAKRTGKGRVEVFAPDMRAAATHRTQLQQELAHAVERGEIEVVYQPIIDLAARRPLLLEALARWRPADRPSVPADVFIALAEESGLIGKIGLEVLRTACRAARQWRALPGHADVGVAVNVSVLQVLAGDLVEVVVGVLEETGLPPEGLALEITESAALDDPERVAPDIAALRALGIRIAVDDFGAGYSSLSLLTSLEFSTVKIDRSLLDFDTTRRGSMVMAIAELGHTLGLRVVAEGVETPGHLHRAREACCDDVQGFYLSRPLPADAVAGFLLNWQGVERYVTR